MGVEGLENESVVSVMVCLGSGELGGRDGGRKGERERGGKRQREGER